MIPIFLAVDNPDFDKARDLLKILGHRVHLKLGLEFFYAHGAPGCRFIKDAGAAPYGSRKLILDIKPDDIPPTVAGAIRSVGPIEADYITVHTRNGPEALLAAVSAAKEVEQRGFKRPKLLGVTVMTSSDLGERAILTRVKKRTIWAKDSGLDGVVCSVLDVKAVRAIWPDAFVLTPGIYTLNPPGPDQKRTATARQAVDTGSSAMVIGRDIMKAADPVAAVEAIRGTME